MSQRRIKARHLANRISSGRPNQRTANVEVQHPTSTEPRRMTLETKHRRIAATFRNHAQFEQFLGKLSKNAQGTARELLTPYLSFKTSTLAESSQVL